MRASSSTVADILTPGGLDGTEALLKLGGVGFGEMALSIALHVDGTELDISIGKEAFADLEKAGKSSWTLSGLRGSERS